MRDNNMAASTSHAFIGVAWIENDGTIKMRLYSPDRNSHAGMSLVYPVSHRYYQAVFDHLGPMRPGENVPVRPLVR